MKRTYTNNTGYKGEGGGSLVSLPCLSEVRTTKFRHKKVDDIDMTSKEMKSIKKRIDSKFAEKLKNILIEDQEYFALDDGRVICVALIASYEAVLIEYADSIEAAKKNCFEDGDLFYLDAADADAIYQAMLREIDAKDRGRSSVLRQTE